MNWKFTILDRDGNGQVIDEPVGWDATKIKITRDREKHGVMIDFQYNEFRFYGTAMRLLKNEYEEYGAEGNMRLKIELNCETAEAVAYTGRFVFKGYKYNSGNDCFVTIGIEQDSDAMTLFNRFDQAVDLQTTKGFDGTTELAPYDRLPFSIVLPSKGIKLTNEAEEELKTSGKVLGVEKIVSGGFSYNVEMGHVAVAMSKTKASEIGFYIPNAISYQTVKKGVGAFLPPFDQENVFELPLSWSQKIYIWPEGTAPVVNWSEDSTGFNGESITPSLDLRIKGQIKLLDATANRIAGVIAKLDEQSNITYLHIEEIYVDSPHLAKGTVVPFDFEYHNAAYVLNPGDRIYALITCGHFKTDDDAENLRDAFEISFDEDSYWNMYLISYALPSLAKVFMVNEAWSRIAEAITDGKIRVLSDYFGRTDSQPYSHPQDGCGALQVISKGLFVRRQENRMDEPFVAALSLKDMWDGLNPIHNIGIGLEPDPNRPGHLVLRIEPYGYFYDDTVLMTCSNVDRIVKASEENRIYSLFKFGYQKWEAEEYNGLDEFLTKRTYRTTLATVRNQIERLSAFIASGYAWEITRRKGNEDSKDWRYDNDTFIACVTRDDREASLTLTGSFLASSFFTNDNPVDFKTGDIVEITGTVSNAGTYTIERITEIGTGGYAIYFTTPVSFESGVSITMTLLSPGFIIEQGNVGSAEQIIDPDTIYNFRISPVRVALKWLSNVMASYKKDRPDNKLVFVDGEGNYMAAGELTDDSCRLENGKLSEKEVLEKSILEAPETALPLQRTETIEFTYPMSFVQFVTLLNNSRGLIEYDTQDGEFGKGWIAEVTYRPAEGLADFLLIPKFEA